MKRVIIPLIVFLLWPCRLPAEQKQPRIVSLAPSITESLFALGVDENQIAGITDYCNYPPRTARIRKVGSLMNANIETIVSINPDYVFSSGSESSPSNVRLKDAGLRLVILNAESVEGTMSNILRLGELLNRREASQKIILDMKERLDKVKNKVDKIKIRKKVYVEIWDDPITSAGRGSLVSEVVTMAGGVNISGGLDILYPALSPEFVIQSDPDCILIGYMSRNQELTKNAVLKRMGWKDISAVRSRNVICDIDPDIFLRPGPRIAEGIEMIYRRLYENG